MLSFCYHLPLLIIERRLMRKWPFTHLNYHCHFRISQDIKVESMCCNIIPKLTHTCSISLHLLLRARYFLLSRALLSSSSCVVLSSSSLLPGPSSTCTKSNYVTVLWSRYLCERRVSNRIIETEN